MKRQILSRHAFRLRAEHYPHSASFSKVLETRLAYATYLKLQTLMANEFLTLLINIYLNNSSSLSAFGFAAFNLCKE